MLPNSSYSTRTLLPDCAKLHPARLQVNGNPRCQLRAPAVPTVNTSQVLETELEARIESHYSASTAPRSQPIHSKSPTAGRDMGSRVHIPQHKVLTTNMIAQATNKNVEQVRFQFASIPLLTHQCATTACTCRCRNLTSKPRKG